MSTKKERRNLARRKPSFRERQLKMNKKQSVSLPKYKKIRQQFIQERNKKKVAIVLIPILMFAVLFMSVATLKTIQINFHSEMDDIDDYDRVVLVVEQNGEIVKYDINRNIFEIPKNSKITEIRVYDSETTYNESFEEQYIVDNAIDFLCNVSQENIEYEEGINYKNTSRQWRWANRYYKERIIKFSLNKSYTNVKNLTINFRFDTNETLNYLSVSYRNFFSNYWDLQYNKNDLVNSRWIQINNSNIDYPSVFLNHSALEDTNFEIRFYGYKKNLGFNYQFDIEYVNISGYFWKDVSTIFEYQSTNITIENIIEVSNKAEIETDQFIIETIITITQIYSFGSFIETLVYTIINTITYEETKQSFPIEDVDINTASGYGTIRVDIEIKDISLKKHTIERKIRFPRIISL